MEHIAIDLGSPESQICRRNTAGDILEERRCGIRLIIMGWPPCGRIRRAFGASNDRAVRRQHRSEKLAQGKRIGRPPRDRALGVQAFEIADQQQPEVAARRQAWSTLARVEPLALDEAVEVVLVENLIQSRVERMGSAARQAWVATHIEACFASRRRLPIAIGDV